MMQYYIYWRASLLFATKEHILVLFGCFSPSTIILKSLQLVKNDISLLRIIPLSNYYALSPWVQPLHNFA
jgi:hypothetical protein